MNHEILCETMQNILGKGENAGYLFMNNICNIETNE